jgi:hypothetical protein
VISHGKPGKGRQKGKGDGKVQEPTPHFHAISGVHSLQEPSQFRPSGMVIIPILRKELRGPLPPLAVPRGQLPALGKKWVTVRRACRLGETLAT